MRLTAPLLVLGAVLSVAGCKEKNGPVTPEASAVAGGHSSALPSPTANGSTGSVTGTPTGQAPLSLPPVTYIPAPTASATTPASTPVATNAASSTSTPTVTNTSTAGPVTAVIGIDSASEPTVADAKRVIEDYYAAVNRGAYDSAFRMWADNGLASGKTLQRFTDGYADTSSVSINIGDPGPIDAGAGQRHIVIPVRVIARQRDQSTKTYSGTYTLGRTVVDGASAEQKSWRIQSADIRASGG